MLPIPQIVHFRFFGIPPPHQILPTPLRTYLPGLLSVQKRAALCGRYGCGRYRLWPISSFSVQSRAFINFWRTIKPVVTSLGLYHERLERKNRIAAFRLWTHSLNPLKH